MIRRFRNAVGRDGLGEVLCDIGIITIAAVGSVASFALAYLSVVWIYQGLSS